MSGRTSADSVRYSPIIESNDFRSENGLTPLNSQTDSVAKLTGKVPHRQRAMSVDTVTQTGNGTVITMPRLHIPGETGELAGLSSELSGDEPDGQQNDMIAPEKLKQVYAQIKAKKIKYKLIFSTAVISMLIIAYASVAFPWFLPYYHTIVFPLLYIIRVIMYAKSHWQLYCLDFCYAANLGLLIFCWAYPRSEIFFAVIFGCVAGPVAVATVVFRNSIVFHDYDRLTSSYIHLVPNIVIYLIKWYPRQTSVNWYFHANYFTDISIHTNATELTTKYLPNWVDASWFWIVVVPLLWFIIHTVLYMLLENCCFTDKKYLTSYKWLTSNLKSPIYYILTLNGSITNQTKVKASWLLFSIIYGVLSFLIARLCYEYQTAHTVYVVLMHTAAIYNGASFYIDVFAKRGLGVSNG